MTDSSLPPALRSKETRQEQLTAALRQHQAGDHEAAERSYRDILRDSPQDADALHLLGVLAYQRGCFETAVEYLTQAIRIQPGSSLFYSNLGASQSALEQFPQAIESLLAALRMAPDYAEAHFNLAVAYQRSMRPDAATDEYRQILQIDPRHIQARLNLGRLLFERGDFSQAEVQFCESVAIDSCCCDAHFGLGNAQFRQRKWNAAIASFQNVIRIHPKCPEAHYNLGNAFRAAERIDEAVTSYRTALAIQPDFAAACNNLGEALQGQGHASDALECFQKAKALQPDSAEAATNLGQALRQAGNLVDALASCREAIRLKPQFTEAHLNLGDVLADQREYPLALESYRRALSLEPDHAEAHAKTARVYRDQLRFAQAIASYTAAIERKPTLDSQLNRAALRLAQGDFERGWPEYDACRTHPDLPHRLFSQPIWDGAPLEGRTILLHAEQGLGDTLQFVRYAPHVKRRGGTVIVECQPPLLDLLADLPGIDRVYPAGAELPRFDVQASLVALPGIFRTDLDTIPGDIPYLRANAELVVKWRERLAEIPDFKVGIYWQGNPLHFRDQQRSIPLRSFIPLCRIPGVRVISLQQGPGREQLEFLTPDVNLTDLGADLTRSGNGLTEMAALVSQLDLVITCDTCILHLAGALGIATWAAIPYLPDWRWLLERTDTPWYPTVRLFRQTHPGDWGTVIHQMADALPELLPLQLRNWPSKAGESRLLRTQRPEGVGRKPLALPPASNAQSAAAYRTVKTASSVSHAPQHPDRLAATPDVRLSRTASALIPSGAVVLDLGCRTLDLGANLPWMASTVAVDLFAEDVTTRAQALDRGELPDKGAATHVALLGVLEYVRDLPGLLRRLTAYGLPLLLSYDSTNQGVNSERRGSNSGRHRTQDEFLAELHAAGLVPSASVPIDRSHLLVRAVPGTSSSITRHRILILSCLNTSNFGDRLGYWGVNNLLPPESRVFHGYFDTADNFKPVAIPSGEFDLVILGIGNSLFSPMLTDELVRVLYRARHAIGIFGTQYRRDIDSARLASLLDRLNVWYARYEEDILIYGRNRVNAVHLGDPLISSIPLTEASIDATLHVELQSPRELPLDRTIQQIQRYKRVFSERLHPFLCALTSAEQVAYREQHQWRGGHPSGKFRSLLMDVFGRSFPEETLFDVDRDAVAAYKKKVEANLTRIRERLAVLLGTSARDSDDRTGFPIPNQGTPRAKCA